MLEETRDTNILSRAHPNLWKVLFVIPEIYDGLKLNLLQGIRIRNMLKQLIHLLLVHVMRVQE